MHMDRFHNGSYRRNFAFPRGFQEKFPEYEGGFWQVASFVGECLTRDEDAELTVQVRTANNRPYQLEIVHRNKEGAILGRKDFLPEHLDCSDSLDVDECLSASQALVLRARKFLTQHVEFPKRS